MSATNLVSTQVKTVLSWLVGVMAKNDENLLPLIRKLCKRTPEHWLNSNFLMWNDIQVFMLPFIGKYILTAIYNSLGIRKGLTEQRPLSFFVDQYIS